MTIRKKAMPTYEWSKASLTPMAKGIFTDAFYPAPKPCGTQEVYFTQVEITPRSKKVIVASAMSETGIRMMTMDLARACLVPLGLVSVKEAGMLNALAQKLKV